MQKKKTATIRRGLLSSFEEIWHNYPTHSSKYSLTQPPAFVNYATFLGTTILPETGKNNSHLFIFKARLKEKLLPTDNKLEYFEI